MAKETSKKISNVLSGISRVKQGKKNSQHIYLQIAKVLRQQIKLKTKGSMVVKKLKAAKDISQVIH
jgi:hypothetical protein